MARCRCAEESACTCVLTGGPGVTVSGSGAPSSPWLITMTAGTIEVQDTPSIDFTKTGSEPAVISARAIIAALLTFIDSPTGVDFTVTGLGTEASPMQVSASIPLIDLAATANNGEVLTWQNGQYVPGPAAQVPIGAISTGPGIDGDGSGADPLRIDLCSYAELKAACATP